LLTFILLQHLFFVGRPNMCSKIKQMQQETAFILFYFILMCVDGNKLTVCSLLQL